MAEDSATKKASAIGQLNDELAQAILRSSENNPLVGLGLDRVGVDQMTTLFKYPINADGLYLRGGDIEKDLSRVGYMKGSPVDLTKPTVAIPLPNQDGQTPRDVNQTMAHEYGHAGIGALANLDQDRIGFRQLPIGRRRNEIAMRAQDYKYGSPKSREETLAYLINRYGTRKEKDRFFKSTTFGENNGELVSDKDNRAVSDGARSILKRGEDARRELSDKAGKILYDEGKRMNRQEVGKDMASKGRYGDTMLVHMNPIEVDALAKMSPTGKLTTNPDTGQPEAFLPLLAAMGGGYLGGALGYGALGAGLGSFAGSLAQGDDFETALAGGLLSYGTAGMLNAAGGTDAAALASGTENAATNLAANAAVDPALGQPMFMGVPVDSASAGLSLSPDIASMAPPSSSYLNFGGPTNPMASVVSPVTDISSLPTPMKKPASFINMKDLGTRSNLNADSVKLPNGKSLTMPSPPSSSVMGPRIAGSPVPLPPPDAMGPRVGYNMNNPSQLTSPLAQFDSPYNLEMSKAAGDMPLAKLPPPGGMMGRVSSMYNDLPAAIGPDTITNPAYTEKGFFDKLSYLKDQGFNKSVNNAITGNPIATTAAGLGLLGGGTGSLSNPAPQPAIPDFTTAGRTYAKRPFQKQGVARSFVDAPDGYRPGFDPERSYLSPISTYNQGFATGGIVGLMPKVPKIRISGGYESEPDDFDVNDVANDTDFGQPGGRVGVGPNPGPPDDPISVGEVLGSAVVGALTGGLGMGVVSGITNAGMQAMGAPTVMGVAADAFTGGQTSTGTGGMSGADISDVNDAANDTGFGPPDGAPGSNSGGAGSSGGQGDPDGPGGAVGDDSSNWAVGGKIEDGAEQENPIITNAKAAIAGQHPEPQKAIGQFVQVYGDEAFMQLRNQVIAEQSLDQREDAGLGGMITGPGTGTSDSIPAKITQNGKPVEDIRVADGEYILPDATVQKIGKDNLDEIVMATNGKQPNQS